MAQSIPFSYPVDVSVLPKSGHPVDARSDEESREKLAAEFDLLEVRAFELTGKLRRWKSNGARFIGELKADVLSACVVTDEPVLQKIEEKIELSFLPEGSRLLKPEQFEDGELVLDVEAEDPPEMFTGNMIDLGAVATEYFSLALDPFPRADDAPEVTSTQIDDPDEDKPSSFAALAALKASSQKDDK